MGRKSTEITASQSTPKAMHEMMQPEMQAIMMPQERIVFLSGDVNEHSITQVQAQLITLANISNLPIHMVVSTYGGSVDEMFSLYDTLNFIKTPVHTIGLGKVMSAGVLLLAAGQKGKRLIGKHARIMIHPISGGSGGNVFEMRNDVQEQERLQDLMADALLRETKMKRHELEKIMKVGHECFLTANDAVRLGIADNLI